MRLPATLALRNIQQSRTRSLLGMLAVALAVAMTIAADVISRSLMTLLTRVEDVKVVAGGLFGQIDTILGMIGVAVSAAAGFMVLNAFLMSVTQRRRQIGLLRSLGMTAGQVLRLMLLEALIVGGAGTLVGVAGGFPFAWLLQALLKRFGGPMFSAWSGGSSSPTVVLLAAGLGLGASELAVLVPAWQAARVAPLAALHDELAQGHSDTKRKRRTTSAGLALMAGVLLYLIVAPPGKWAWHPLDLALLAAFILLWLAALALALPGLVDATAWLVRCGLALWRRLPPTRPTPLALRLAADNLARAETRGRVMLTSLALAVGLAMMVGLRGGMAFLFDELFGPVFQRTVKQQMFTIASFDPSLGAVAYASMESLRLPAGVESQVRQVVGERGDVMRWDFVTAPEISFFPDYFSFVLSAQDLRAARDWAFKFSQGDWEHALPIMEKGCGVLLTPLVARNNGAGLYEHLDITSPQGRLDCVVAGIGQPYVNASIISTSVRESFALSDPFVLAVAPKPGIDRSQLIADMRTITGQHGLALVELNDLNQIISQATDQLGAVASALLLLAVLAAALGVINTTLISIAERRREMGLLRAVGATRRQVTAAITGEAALTGVIGGVWGLAAGLGVTLILATVYGGNTWGVPDLDLWAAAGRSAQPALATGLLGLLAAPFVCATAAWLPARSILHGTAIESLQVERPIRPHEQARWGTLQKRVAASTALVMTLVLTGLIAVATRQARQHFEEIGLDSMRKVASLNAGLIELALPKAVHNLDWNALRARRLFGSDQSLSQFKALKEDMRASGVARLSVVDRDNIVLIDLDVKNIGMTLDDAPHTTTGQAGAFYQNERGRWVAHVSVPIRNQDGAVVGSTHLIMDAQSRHDLQSRLWIALGSLGLAMVLAGVLVSACWAGSRPPPTRQACLAIALTVLMAAAVGVLALVAVPIQRDSIETMLKNNLGVGVKWAAHAASTDPDLGLPALLRGRRPELPELLAMSQALDLEWLQEMAERVRGDDVAYVALVDDEGMIALADQLALVDERVGVPADTGQNPAFQDSTWHGEKVWIITTPLRRGGEGEPFGALRVAVRREGVEDFLAESQRLFLLAGLAAALAGVLLAQAISGAVAAQRR
jgi:ABC-type lipoprotein release transport system permease subunit